MQSFLRMRGLTLLQSFMQVVCLAFAEKRSCQNTWMTMLLMLL